MSVRGEFRRLGGDLLAMLRESAAARDEADALDKAIERAARDLSGAARDALALLERLDPPSDAALRRRFDHARERLDAVCRIILGRPSA